ncbi:sigma-70 family RNA polymerase sigma factor [Clostridium formicaceticum]|uniref:RNA polymerase sigma factor SigX n=2 Tax=Clostridium formicaceticum TaxID=1497 RepID=A0AAC9WFS7_9CLOT|nr:sigma-70 family RNA polymerase sigma factor [Clostridium formicaceticum]AOY75801.1 RNA polymerase subunit sigma-24 [Clostridium formicaceticum]ARE86130.1 RNA polymerase sigma factor SigX [Clostridium formicaceticum]
MQQFALINVLDKGDIKKNICNEEAFTHIFETYYRRVYNYIYYRVHCQSTAEDLTSQVFEKIMISIDKYDEKRAPFEVWLFAIAKNILRDHFRSLKKQKFFSFSLDKVKQLVSREKTPEDMILITETNDELIKAIKTLDERERNIIAFKFGGNLKNNEIAKILHITESNVGVILYRSMKKLKKEMEREEWL